MGSDAPGAEERVASRGKRKHDTMNGGTMKASGIIRRMAAAALSSVMAVGIAVGIAAPTPAYADSGRVVTLGADLTDEQRETVLSFFGLTDGDLDGMQVITVTNQDERKYLSSTVPSEEIGTKTLSCSYIQPKSSGGINVQTANLTYVTKEVLYNALQTAGVENCDLVVTAPYEVSGTGALTGVFMAYEQSGNALDQEKEEAATKEMVDTANLQSTYGEAAPEIVSDVKNEVAGNTQLTDDQIRDIIKKAAAAKGVTLTDQDIDTILAIAKQVQSGGYSSDAFSKTLESAKDRLDGIDTSKADGVLGAIQSFFESVGDFFARLFGIAKDSGNSIIDSLNTNVYALDDGTQKTNATTTSDTGTAIGNATTGGTTTNGDATQQQGATNGSVTSQTQGDGTTQGTQGGNGSNGGTTANATVTTAQR